MGLWLHSRSYQLGPLNSRWSSRSVKLESTKRTTSIHFSKSCRMLDWNFSKIIGKYKFWITLLCNNLLSFLIMCWENNEIEVNVFSFIHQETRIIRNNLLSLEFHLIIDGAIGLYNLCVYIPYGLRKEFLYLVFYVFPGYFRFFTFCVMTGFH